MLPILEHCLHMFCKNIWNLEQNKCKAKSNDKDHWRRVLFQITNGVRSLIFYWGSADHIQRDVEVWWRGMTWVVARPLTFDSLANLVTLAAFCWCRTPSPWWRVHFFFFFKYQQYFFIILSWGWSSSLTCQSWSELPPLQRPWQCSPPPLWEKENIVNLHLLFFKPA